MSRTFAEKADATQQLHIALRIAQRHIETGRADQVTRAAILLACQLGSQIDPEFLNCARSRNGPVLVTASVAALGLIPAMLAHGLGSDVQRPLVTVVVGGLVTATLLTLPLPALCVRPG